MLPAKSNRQVMAESNRVGVQFLVAEIEIALTFLEVADVTRQEDVRNRNRENARVAYDTVLKLLPKVSPSECERSTLEAKLEELKKRLLALGYLGNVPGRDQSI